MDLIYESANNFMKLKDTKYHFVFVQNRKKHEVVLDFCPSDYRHATGLHHVTDIVMENNPLKLIDSILNKKPAEVTDIKLSKSKKYKEISPWTGSVEERVSDMRYIENCLDTSEFMRIYKTQSFGSWINADYFIETYCKELRAFVYIFIRKRDESNNYVIVSFLERRLFFKGFLHIGC